MRKKVLALIIILCLALGALAAFAACDNTGKLDTPSGFTLNKETQTLSWTPVDNAYAYDFYVTDEQGNRSNVNNIRVQEDEDGNVITPSQSLAGITASGTYTIHVQALANPDELDVSGNPVHQDSDVAEYTYVRGNRYGNPQNVVAKYTHADGDTGTGAMGLRVTFNAVEGAANYTVQILSGSTLLTEVDTDSVSNWFETYIEKDSDGNETTERFSDNPGTYTVQVRANAASESNDIPSAWSRTSENVTAQLSNPLITQYSFTSETSQRLRWTQVPNASSITVEAWKIDTTDKEPLNDSALTLFQNIEEYAKNHDADYTYTTSSGTAQNTLLSSLNMTEAGEYLITVKANGNDTIYFSSPRVNTVTSSQATAESHLYTATVIFPVTVSGDMPADGNTVNVSFNDINAQTHVSGISDTLYIRFTQDILDNANMFKIILSSVNTSSSNSLSDVTASVRLELGTGENEGKIIIRSGSDEYEAATLTQEGDDYLLTYSLERIFHSAAEEGSQPTHNQSSSNMYGRYFNVSVQACYYQSENIGASDEGLTGNVTAHLPSGSVTLETSCLSACEPEFDAATNTYTIKTTHLTNDEGGKTGVYATARAQLMYIQKLMLSGDNCAGKTFVIAEDVDFNSNAWLALDSIEFAGTIKSADIEYSEGVTRSGEYTISNMHILNRAALEYARTEEHGDKVIHFSDRYAMFPVFDGTLSHVNFRGINATDAEYSYTVPGQEATEDTEATEDEEKYQRANITGVIAGENNGTIEYVYVGGTFEAINTSGVIAAVNNGTITACESDISFSATAYAGDEGEEENTAYVGGLVGHNKSMINASLHRGDVSLTNTALSSTALGGFVGLNEGTIENSFATGNVSDGGTTVMLYTGGFAGSNAAGATITNSYYGSKFTAGAYGNIGEVRAEHVGGFVGSNAGTISYAYAVARVNGGATAGGFAAANSGTISYAYSAGTTRINTTVPSFVYGAATPENCFMYDYNGGEQGGSLAGLNNSALTSNGFSVASAYQTPLLDGLLYVESYSETVSIDGTPAITGVMTVDGSEYNIGYNSTATADGYTVTVYVSGGPGRFDLSGSAVVKYVVTDGTGSVVSCITVNITVR